MVRGKAQELNDQVEQRNVLWRTFLMLDLIQPSASGDEETEGLGHEVQLHILESSGKVSLWLRGTLRWGPSRSALNADCTIFTCRALG